MSRPPRTKEENRRLAQRIFSQLGPRITDVCENSYVPTAYLAGLISVEDASLDESATRFEPRVFIDLQNIRDGQPSKRKWVKQSDILDASDSALENLATSFGLTQIMGFHVIKTFNKTITIDDLRDPKQHLKLAIHLIKKEAGKELKMGAFEKALRIHNTGNPDGETHDDNYVDNALGVMQEYEGLEGSHKTRFREENLPAG
jgi:hypothetical protein